MTDLVWTVIVLGVIGLCGFALHPRKSRVAVEEQDEPRETIESLSRIWAE